MSNRRAAASASAAALASWLATLACCLPLPAVLAAGSLGAAGSWLPGARPYLSVLAAAALAYAFYRLYHRKFCDSRRPAYLQLMVWLSLALLVVTTLAPERFANLLAGPPRVPAVLRTSLGPQAEMLTIRDVSALREAFNRERERWRVMALFSPT